jgi:polysaccharide export outer membrane protein
MLRTDRNYQFDVPPDNPESQYRIIPNDIIEFRLFANEGFKIIDLSSGTEGGQFIRNININYLIEADGSVRLPLLDTCNLKGKTVRESEIYLEKKYAEFYVNPFVQIQVVNKRVIVFPGNGSDARVITLTNNNTTLMEAIAMAGGITERGKAKRIKLVRKNLEGKRAVYLIDLSTMEGGLKYADMVVQANDYIYVEPVPQYGREILTNIAPYISILSSAILIYTVFQRF